MARVYRAIESTDYQGQPVKSVTDRARDGFQTERSRSVLIGKDSHQVLLKRREASLGWPARLPESLEARDLAAWTALQAGREPQGLAVVWGMTLAAHRQGADAPGDFVVRVFGARATVLRGTIVRFIIADLDQMGDVPVLD
jgi:hypothetical protein